MSTVAPETPPSGLVVSLENLLFDYPGADIILRSCDSYEFRVLKTYIFHSSPLLGERVLSADNPQSGTTTPADAPAASLPVAQLSDGGVILFSLLTYIFPVQSILPSTVEQTMELLSVAKRYKMDAVLAHIRNHISQQHPPFIREGNSLYIYSLAQKHGLRQEALHAARSTLSLPILTTDDLDEKLDLMPSIFLHELWKYHQRVRAKLTSNLEDFIASRAHEILEADSPLPQRCPLQGSQSWLREYISSIGTSPHLFDLSIFHMTLTTHIIQSLSKRAGCRACEKIPHKRILEFWAALSEVHRGSITEVESDLLLVERGTNVEGHPIPRGRSPQFRYTDMPGADVILQSSDLVNFRIHSSILATSSPFFGDLFSLPQPTDHEKINGLPVVRLPEDAEVLNGLVTTLYPIPSELPNSDDKILTLLAACQKYDMTTVQSFIRAEVSRRGLLSPTGAESFRLFAVAYKKRLIPEMKAVAHLTFEYPMTLEYLGEALRSFEGCALSDLARFRWRCKQGIISCFLDSRKGPSKVWVGCPSRHEGSWLGDIFEAKISGLPNAFMSPFVTPSNFRDHYLDALRGHVSKKDCTFCMKTHTLKGEEFCEEIEKKLAQAVDVQYSFRIELPASESTPSPSESACYFSLGPAGDLSQPQ